MNDDQIGDLLSELAGVDTQDTDLRHHPDAYAAVEVALAPLLQDLAAHEASNRIRGENLETLRAENAKLREALAGLVKINEEHDAAVAGIVGSPLNWKDDYLNAARAALGESE